MTGAQRRRAGRGLGALLLGLVASGLVACSPASSGRSPTAPTTTSVVAGVAEGSVIEPTGPQQRSEDDAAAAAARSLAELARLTRSGPTGREAALRRMVSEDSGPIVAQALAAMASVDQTVAGARAVLPGARMMLREVPVAFVVRDFSPDRAQVAVWGLSLVLIEGRTQATEVWSTNVVDLTWEAGTWRVAGWTRTPGPVPAAGLEAPTDPRSVLNAVDGWEGFSYVPSP